MGVVGKLHTIAEVADILRISRRTVMRLMASGKLRCVKVGSRTLFEEHELRRFVDACRT